MIYAIDFINLYHRVNWIEIKTFPSFKLYWMISHNVIPKELKIYEYLRIGSTTNLRDAYGTRRDVSTCEHKQNIWQHYLIVLYNKGCRLRFRLSVYRCAVHCPILPTVVKLNNIFQQGQFIILITKRSTN